jgi:hypothetical protein
VTTPERAAVEHFYNRCLTGVLRASKRDASDARKGANSFGGNLSFLPELNLAM